MAMLQHRQSWKLAINKPVWKVCRSEWVADSSTQSAHNPDVVCHRNHREKDARGMQRKILKGWGQCPASDNSGYFQHYSCMVAGRPCREPIYNKHIMWLLLIRLPGCLRNVFPFQSAILVLGWGPEAKVPPRAGCWAIHTPQCRPTHHHFSSFSVAL